jgi:hypothetical protein
MGEKGDNDQNYTATLAVSHLRHTHINSNHTKSINMGHKGNKSFLPTKNCVVCGKPFTWRKKWERCWDEVKYCSDRCRKSKD